MPRAMENRWIEQKTWMYMTRTETHALGVYIHSGFGVRPRYAVVAVETSSVDAPSMRAVLDNHAHLVIAENVATLTEAKKKARTYVARWRVSRQHAEACRCKEIAA